MCKLENWDENNKVNILKCLCVETALIYVNSHPDIDDPNFDELVSFLEKRFRKVISKQEAWSQFTNIRQGYLSLNDYKDKIIEISENVLDTLMEFENLQNRDQFLISIFINGLNIEIKKLIDIQEFNSYSVCVQAALKADKILQNKKIVNNINNPNDQTNIYHNGHPNTLHTSHQYNNPPWNHYFRP